jgi:4a-hydroxytetrahydrobiopterin dehydratase
MALHDEACMACRDGGPTLEIGEVAALRAELPGWEVMKGHHLHKSMTFVDFTSALA